MQRGNNKLLSLLLLLLFSSFLAARATSDSDLINSEVGLTAKQRGWVRGEGGAVKEWMSGPLGLRGTRAGEGVLIHFAAACALSVGVNFDEQQEDAQSEREGDR